MVPIGADLSSGGIWPVAIRITLTALPITSAGRFWPLGPVGMGGSMACRATVWNVVRQVIHSGQISN
jgi:hypothetical protein